MRLTSTSNFIVRAAGPTAIALLSLSRPSMAQTVDATGFIPTSTPAAMVPADYDGDGRIDIGIWRASSGRWLISASAGSVVDTMFGAPSAGDIPVPADWDGDGRADVAVYRYPTGQWFLFQSSIGARTVAWGTAEFGDVPVQADYDGDGRADFGVYRSATGQFYVALSGGGMIAVTWGDPASDVPVVGDFDGDGKADLTVYSLATGRWRSLLSSGGTADQAWGAPSLGDIPVAADYNADGRTDRAVYRNSTGQWLVQTETGVWIVNWGAPTLGDMPVPADYDGDGRADIAVYRSASGEWFVLRSSDSSLYSVAWGAPALRDLARIELRPTFTLVGVVADATIGVPLFGARVSVVSGPHAGATATTDTSGRYTIPGLTRGTITLRVTRSGYNVSERSFGMFGNARQDFPLTAVIPPPPPPPPVATFGPGQHLVGIGIPSGRYFSSPSYGCYWERQSGLGGTLGEIIANEFVGFNAGQWVVDILPSDRAFSTDADCGTWSTAPRPAPPTGTITPGVWMVNAQIAPGLYRANAAPGCYWERRRDFQGVLGSIIANDFVAAGGTVFVQINPGDAGFLGDGDCGTWTRVQAVSDRTLSFDSAGYSKAAIEENRTKNRQQDGFR